ncbi:MAG: heavy-metal-associated domain-containing protein [Rikenellaceae bacterium]
MKKLLSICLILAMGFSVATVAAKTSDKNTTTVSKSAAKKAAKEVLVTTLFMADIDCPTCEKTIMNKIPYEKGVKDVKVDIKAKTVEVTYDSQKSSEESLLKAFKKIKIEAKVAPARR